MTFRAGLRVLVSTTSNALPSTRPVTPRAATTTCVRPLSSRTGSNHRCRCWPNPPCHRSDACNYASFEAYGCTGAPRVTDGPAETTATMTMETAGAALGAHCNTILANMLQQHPDGTRDKTGVRLA